MSEARLLARGTMFRPVKVLKIVIPVAVVLAASVVLFYLWVMRWQLTNRVTFQGAAALLSEQDQQAIRELVLAHDTVVHPADKLVRYSIDFNTRRDSKNGGSSLYIATLKPNIELGESGFISVQKVNEKWEVTLLTIDSTN